MKKIMMISDNAVLGKAGGSFGEHEQFDGLKMYAEHHNCELKIISIDEPFEYSFSEPMAKNRKIDIMSRVLGHSTFVYFAWQKVKKQVIEYNPDMLVLGRSRMGFIAKDCKKTIPQCKIICYSDNAEYDYVDAYFSGKKGPMNKANVMLEKLCTYRDEKDLCLYSDAISYLTERDHCRYHELYPVKAGIEVVLPICIENGTTLSKVTNKKTVVFIGSLHYGANKDALSFFVQKVWNPYFANREDMQLIVGGANPSAELTYMLTSVKNCHLFNNFHVLEDIVPKHSMMIAPIKKGAGMKVKVAETLSMGLMIAASDEALVGYEAALKLDTNGAIIRANTIKEYKDAIDFYCQKTKQELDRVEVANKNLYKKLYSYEVSRASIANMCSMLLEGV